VSGDKDEHIRISVFPETWIIYAMGLSHTAFVSCVISVGERIISGGGDNRVIQWDEKGRVVREYVSMEGSCVRCLRRWKERLVVVGERWCCCRWD
jgi:hypothetical protein